MIFPKTARPGLAQSTRDTANFAVKKIGIMAHPFLSFVHAFLCVFLTTRHHWRCNVMTYGDTHRPTCKSKD